jgi:hypothetical protein
VQRIYKEWSEVMGAVPSSFWTRGTGRIAAVQTRKTTGGQREGRWAKAAEVGLASFLLIYSATKLHEKKRNEERGEGLGRFQNRF